MTLTKPSALPTNRDENWRYANLRPLAKARLEAVPPADAPLPELPAPPTGFERWIYVDGHHTRSPLRRGSAATALDTSTAGPEFAAMLDGAIAEAGIDFALARSNAAQGSEVLQVTVPDGAFANVEVLFIGRQSAAQGTSYPRLQVHVGRDAKLNLIERHLSAGTADSAINAAVDVGVAAGAKVTHMRLQNVADAASCFDTLAVNVADNASYVLRTVTLGALASRSTAFIRLAGRSARCQLAAAIVANHTQNHDMFIEIDHAAPDTATREVFRGIERSTAQALLQWAFIEDAVSQVEPAELRREIEGLVAARLLAVSGLEGLLGERS
jgi:Fe-S cluster assembly protein SufD